MVRRLLVAGGAVVAATALFAACAGAAIPPQGKIGPKQFFTGMVNGKSGLGSPAQINMACFGPIRPGQMGHPMAGQSVEVLRPVVISTNDGYTGSNANSIAAFFGPSPPTPVPSTTSTVTFHWYGVVKAIPTSLLLPCSGTGTVTFVPLPMSPPTSRDSTVPVTYVGQP
jgi:hypothetical protein